MIKHLAITIVTLQILIFFSGCTPEKIEPTPPEEIEEQIPVTDITEPNFTEPNVITEPNLTEPTPAQPPPEPKTSAVPPVVTDTYKRYADILKAYVDDNGMVNYKNLKWKKYELKNLIQKLANLDPDEYSALKKQDKIAFWLNIYNIQMLYNISDNYPIESSRVYRLWWPPSSIRHIPPIDKVGSAKWNGYKFIVMDEEFTLLEIERRFFRGQFNEPKILLGLTLACKASPPLLNEPYYGNKLYEQIDEQIRKFLTSSYGLKIDKEKQNVHLSALFETALPGYGNDFFKKYQTDKKFKSHPPAVRAALNFITNYLSERDVSFLETGNYSVKFQDFDWRLNE